MRLPTFIERESQVVISGQITPTPVGTTIAVAISLKWWLALLYGVVLGLFILISVADFMDCKPTHGLHPMWLFGRAALVVAGIAITYETEGQRVFNALAGIILPFGKQPSRHLRLEYAAARARVGEST